MYNTYQKLVDQLLDEQVIIQQDINEHPWDLAVGVVRDPQERLLKRKLLWLIGACPADLDPSCFQQESSIQQQSIAKELDAIVKEVDANADGLLRCAAGGLRCLHLNPPEGRSGGRSMSPFGGPGLSPPPALFAKKWPNPRPVAEEFTRLVSVSCLCLLIRVPPTRTRSRASCPSDEELLQSVQDNPDMKFRLQTLRLNLALSPENKLRSNNKVRRAVLTQRMDKVREQADIDGNGYVDLEELMTIVKRKPELAQYVCCAAVPPGCGGRRAVSCVVRRRVQAQG